jgi:hypothetical protein
MLVFKSSALMVPRLVCIGSAIWILPTGMAGEGGQGSYIGRQNLEEKKIEY